MYTTIIATATLMAAAYAAPVVDTTFKTFALKVSSSDHRFNGLCVENYHTGAGLADAVLGTCTSQSVEFFQNGTSIQTTGLTGTLKDPAGVHYVGGGGAQYDSWYPVTVSVGYGTNGLTYSPSTGYLQPGGVGFLACKWAHAGNPQLFTFAYKNEQKIVTGNCAKVTLLQG